MLSDRISNTIHRRFTLHLLPDVVEFFRKNSADFRKFVHTACSCFAEICLRFTRRRIILRVLPDVAEFFFFFKSYRFQQVRMSVLCLFLQKFMFARFIPFKIVLRNIYKRYCILKLQSV